jgi:ABC-type Zn uptake system ZnuABC Zn-binding protein ZnuA
MHSGCRLLLSLVGVLIVSSSVWAAPRLQVAATIFPLYDLVRQVAGARAEVVLLVPPGASPHTVAFTPGTVRRLAGSQCLFVIGHGLDDWAARLAEQAGVAQTVIVDTGIALRVAEHGEHGHGSGPGQTAPHGAVDPHYWLAIPHAQHIVRTITATLSRLDPAGREEYERRTVAYQRQLQEADDAMRRVLAGVARREVAFFHPAFTYFAATYGLQIVATFEETPGREPGPQRVATFLRRVRAHQLRVLFIEPQLDSGPITSLARDLGVTLHQLDPLGGSRGRESYLAMMHYNATRIAAALRE